MAKQEGREEGRVEGGAKAITTRIGYKKGLTNIYNTKRQGRRSHVKITWER
jgi:hypothetical protein